jgi:hypothetical protein
MMRKQIYIKKRQQILLKRLAKARGVSEAEIIRQAIDRETNSGSTLKIGRDPAALDEIVRFALGRRKHGATDQPYRWRREDAYEERLSRYDRRSSSSSE